MCSSAYRFLAFVLGNPADDLTFRVNFHDFVISWCLETIQASLYEMIVAVSVHRLTGFPDLELVGLHLWGILAPLGAPERA